MKRSIYRPGQQYTETVVRYQYQPSGRNQLLARTSLRGPSPQGTWGYLESQKVCFPPDSRATGGWQDCVPPVSRVPVRWKGWAPPVSRVPGNWNDWTRSVQSSTDTWGLKGLSLASPGYLRGLHNCVPPVSRVLEGLKGLSTTRS